MVSSVSVIILARAVGEGTVDGEGRGERKEKEIEACARGEEGRGDAGIISRESAPLSFPIVSPIFQFE